MIKAVIFDVDGVLMDSLEVNLEYFKELFETAGYVAPSRDEYRHMFHLAIDDMIRLIAKNPDAEEFQRIKEISMRVEYPIEKIELTKESVDTVKSLAKKYRLAIVTGRLEGGVEDYFKHSGLGEYFETAVHYGDYENPKPHPEPILVALNRLGIEPGEAVFVGDQKTDLESAKSANVPFILFSEYDYGLDDVKLEAKHFSEIPQLIEAMGKK